MIKIIESKAMTPEAIMAFDTALLEECDPEGKPLLHFYEWSVPSLTYGYFTDPAKHLNLEALKQHLISPARRPTGGGIIFHLCDFAFSIVIPANHPRFSLNTLKNYEWINTFTAEAIAQFSNHALHPKLFSPQPSYQSNCTSFCMANPTQFDLILKGKKVGGSAQRKTKRGLLHQGSISLQFPSKTLLLDVLKKGPAIVNAMEENSYCLLPDSATTEEFLNAKAQLKNYLSDQFLNA